MTRPHISLVKGPYNKYFINTKQKHICAKIKRKLRQISVCLNSSGNQNLNKPKMPTQNSVFSGFDTRCFSLANETGTPDYQENSMLNIFRPSCIGILAVLCILLSALTSCGGAEERKAKYMKRGLAYMEEKNYGKAKIEFKNVLQIDPNDAAGYFNMGLIEEANKNLRRSLAFFNKSLELDPTYVDVKLKLARILAVFDPQRATQLNEEVLSDQPNNLEGLINRSLIAARLEQYDTAIEQLVSILNKHPDNIDAATLLASIHGKKNDWNAQLTVLNKAHERNPQNLQLIRMLVKRHIADKNFTQAELMLSKLIEIEPEDANNWLKIAVYYVKTQQNEKAKEFLWESVATYPNDQDRYIHLASFLYKQQGADKGIATLKNFIKDHGDFDQLPGLLARFLIQDGKLDAAEQVYLDQIDLYGIKPEGLGYRNELSLLLLQQGKEEAGLRLLDEVLDENPSDNKALMLKGYVFLKQGKAEEAIGFFRTLLRDQPENANLHATLAQGLLMAKNPELAREHLEKAITLDPKNSKRRLLLAKILANSKQLNEAIAQIDAILIDNPDDLEALNLKTMILARKGDKDGAEKVLREIQEEHPKQASPDFKLGHLYLSQNKLDNALNEFELALSKKPKSVQVLAGLIDTYMAQNEPEQAETVIQQFIDDNPTNPIAITFLGRLYQQQKQYSKSIEQFSKALDINPSLPNTMTALLSSYYQQDKRDLAELYLKQAIQENPNHPIAHFFLGQHYLAEKQLSLAETHLKSAIEVSPKWRQTYETLADFYLSQNNLQRSTIVLEQAIQQLPDDLGLRIKLAEVYQHGDMIDKAIDVYEKILEKTPQTPTAQNNLAVILSEYKTDRINLDKALALSRGFESSDNPMYLDTLGWIYYKLSNYDLALPLLKNAAEKTDQLAITQYHLGMVYHKVGNHEQAKIYLAKSLAIQEDFKGSDEARKVLGNLKAN